MAWGWDDLTDNQKEISKKTGIPPAKFNPQSWAHVSGNIGTRPPDGIIYNSWTPAQRSGIGLDQSKMKEAQRAFRTKVGKHQKAKNLAVAINMASGMDPKAAMEAAGIKDEKGSGRSFYRNFMNRLEGRTSGMYLFNPETGMKHNRFTSGSARGVAVPMTAEDWEHYNKYQKAGDQSWMFDMPIDQSGLTLARARSWQQSGHSSVEDLVSAGKVDEYGFFIDSEGNKIGGNTWIEGMDTPGGSLSSGDWTTHIAGGPPTEGVWNTHQDFAGHEDAAHTDTSHDDGAHDDVVPHSDTDEGEDTALYSPPTPHVDHADTPRPRPRPGPDAASWNWIPGMY